MRCLPVEDGQAGMMSESTMTRLEWFSVVSARLNSHSR